MSSLTFVQLCKIGMFFTTNDNRQRKPVGIFESPCTGARQISISTGLKRPVDAFDWTICFVDSQLHSFNNLKLRPCGSRRATFWVAHETGSLLGDGMSHVPGLGFGRVTKLPAAVLARKPVAMESGPGYLKFETVPFPAVLLDLGVHIFHERVSLQRCV